MARKTTLPIPRPSSEHCAIPTRPAPFPESSQESIKLKSVLDRFCDEGLRIADKEGSDEKRGLDDVERMYMSEEMMLRYLKATRWNVANAIKRLEASLVWRRTLEMYDVEGGAREVELEFESGKVAIIGYTRKSQPLLYTWTARNDKPSSFRQVKHIMFCMERTIDLQLAGVPGVMFCADVSGKTQTQSGAMGVSRQILSYLQAHYPERLGGAGLLKVPWLGSLFVTLMWPFVDADTRRKIHVNPELSKDLVPPDQLLDIYGGEIEFEWTKDYLPALVELCVTRRAENLRRWKKTGGRVGLSEWDFLEHVGGAIEGDFIERKDRAIGENDVTPAQSTAPGPPSSVGDEKTEPVEAALHTTPSPPAVAT